MNSSLGIHNSFPDLMERRRQSLSSRRFSLHSSHRCSSPPSRQCDAESFARIYDSHVDKIYKYIYYKIGTTTQAEDLTAQVFLNAWQAMGRYRWSERPVSAWLFRIAHNLVVDHFRTQHATVPLDDLPFLNDDADVEELAQQHLTAEFLRNALERLTDDQREVILLKFLEGHSTAEVAAILERDPAAVRALQRRALIALARYLRKDAELVEQPRA